MSFETLWAEYQPVVAGIASRYGRQNHRFGADAGDFSQEAAIWMMAHAEWLDEQREQFDDERQFGKFLARCIENEAKDYSVDIRDQAGGQPRLGAYWYSPGEVKILLPSVFDEEAWLNPPQSDGKSVSDPAHGSNWIATLADVARAFSQLNVADQELLRRFHEDDARNVDVAAEFEVTEATMSYRHNQALKRLIGHLGGEKPRHMRADVPHDPFRGRKAIGNAHARAITSNNYEE